MQPLVVATWNVALLARPSLAPPQWGQDFSEAAIRDRVLSWSPDLLFLQELPGFAPFIETHDLVKSNPKSHSGYLGTLTGNHLADEDIQVATVAAPAVLVSFPDHGFSLANVHLAPGAGGADMRLEQLQAILAASPTENLVILGDTNTRVAEMERIGELGLSTPPPPEPTWDSRRNRFNQGPEFIAFFSRGFTRGNVTITQQMVETMPWSHNDQSFHLSDHYPLIVTVEVGKGQSERNERMGS